jgi:hypothetical protein
LELVTSKQWKEPGLTVNFDMKLSIFGYYPGDGISPALASQGNFSETGQDYDPPFNRVITKKSTALCQNLQRDGK